MLQKLAGCQQLRPPPGLLSCLHSPSPGPSHVTVPPRPPKPGPATPPGAPSFPGHRRCREGPPPTCPQKACKLTWPRQLRSSWGRGLCLSAPSCVSLPACRRLLEQVVSCSGLLPGAGLPEEQTVTWFQFHSYLQRQSVSDLEKHFAQLTKEGRGWERGHMQQQRDSTPGPLSQLPEASLEAPLHLSVPAALLRTPI